MSEAAAWVLYTRIFNLTHWKTTKWVVYWHFTDRATRIYTICAIIYYVQIVSFMIVSSIFFLANPLLFGCIRTGLGAEEKTSTKI